MFFLLLGILLLCVCAKIGDILYYRRQKEGEGDSAEETVSASAVEVKVEAEPTKLPQKLASLTATTDEVLLPPEPPGPVIDQPVAINPGRATSYLDLDTNRRVLETSECRPSRRTSDLSEIDDEDEAVQE